MNLTHLTEKYFDIIKDDASRNNLSLAYALAAFIGSSYFTSRLDLNGLEAVVTVLIVTAFVRFAVMSSFAK